MRNCLKKHSPPGWWIFIGFALLLSTTCVVFHGSLLFRLPVHVNSADFWPEDASYLNTWQLDTQLNYTAKLVNMTENLEFEKERVYDFEISQFTTNIDGNKRKVIGVNKQFPGPMIEAVEGDLIKVYVKNSLVGTTTSLHFHGQAMNGTSYFDGAIGITQCGIPPGGSFVYEFVAQPAGTYWYHSHTDLQALKGLIGPLIVHPKNDSNQTFEKDHTIILSDLYNEDPDDLFDVYQEPWLGGDTEPVPSVAITQGKLYATINIPVSRKVKLRLVNAASFTAFRIQLGGSDAKNFTVIEADGTDVTPKTTTSLLVYPAQRYSIVIELENSDWLLTTPQFSFYDDPKEYKQFEMLSSSLRLLLRAENNGNFGDTLPPELKYVPPQYEEDDLVDEYFEPLTSIDTPPVQPHVEKVMDLTMTRTKEGSIAGAVNNHIFRLPEKGNLLEELLFPVSRSMGTLHEFQHNTTSKKILSNTLLVADSWSVIDIIIRNYDDGFHPMHLHGHKGWIIARGSLKDMSKTIEWPKPLKRDTFGIPQKEWMRLRFIVDNPGVWLFHCHIPWHGHTGMRTMIISQPDKLRDQKAPTSWLKLCKGM